MDVGQKSVTQGSTLSCLLYLLYILDIPTYLHEIDHNPLDYRKCNQPNISTFVDDNYMVIRRKLGHKLEDDVTETMNNLNNYMDANELALNGEKTKILLVTKNEEIKKNFEVEIQGKMIKPVKEVKILGTTLYENMSFDSHLIKELIPNLKNRIRTLKLTTKYMSQKFKKDYTNAIFRGKALFAIEAWGGSAGTIITEINKLQEKAAELALKGDLKTTKMSISQKLNKLNWLPISQETELATQNLVHKMILTGIPAEINELMPINNTSMRLKIHRKLAMKPKILNKNKLTRSLFRNRAYIFNILPARITSLIDHKKFKKWNKIFKQNPSKIPKDLNEDYLKEQYNLNLLQL